MSAGSCRISYMCSEVALSAVPKTPKIERSFTWHRGHKNARRKNGRLQAGPRLGLSCGKSSSPFKNGKKVENYRRSLVPYSHLLVRDDESRHGMPGAQIHLPASSNCQEWDASSPLSPPPALSVRYRSWSPIPLRC